MAETEFDWVTTLSGDNFLKVYDVVIDIAEALELSKTASIPLYQPRVKYSTLLPMDTVGWRDAYCKGRWEAIHFLKDKGVLKEINYIEGRHRWESTMKVEADTSLVTNLATIMNTNFEKRPKDTDEESNPDQLAITKPDFEFNNPVITLPWLIKNVSWKLWVSFIGLLIATFIIGVSVAHTTFIKELLGK